MRELGQTVLTRLDKVRERIALACQRAGRSSDDVCLVAVTKTFPHAVVETAVECGIMDLGESRVQELAAKAAAFPQVRWHMIGHLQRNKARDVVAHAEMFHALDSVRLARTLSARAGRAGKTLPCCVQVNVSGEDSKFGFVPSGLRSALAAMADMPNIQLQGLMTLAAPAPDPEQVRLQLRMLKNLLDVWPGFPSRPILSMGMSSDFEIAIEEGATHVRIGSEIFGPRQHVTSG